MTDLIPGVGDRFDFWRGSLIISTTYSQCGCSAGPHARAHSLSSSPAGNGRSGWATFSAPTSSLGRSCQYLLDVKAHHSPEPTVTKQG